MLVCITGGSAGFGESIARKFIQENHQVILLARRKDKLLTLQKEFGKNCRAIIAQDINAIDKISMELKPYVHEIDILVNNAGLALGMEPSDQCNIEDWETMIQTNILGVIKLTHLILPFMVNKKHGHIINIGSVAGSYPYPGGNIYGASKAFIKQFSLNLRADLVGKNIRVTNIEPGLAGGSEFSIVRFRGDANKAKTLYENTNPLQPQDIAESVFWCATLPEHVNINRIELMPTTQAFSPFNVHKRSN